MTTTQSQPAARPVPMGAVLLLLIGSVILLFARLGHYALWDDEAITAMTARAVWQTGDTSVRVDDHNLLVYRNGLLVRNFKDRYTPPLQFYLIAPFIGLLGESNFVCRLPMAICGSLTVGIILRWLVRVRPPPMVWWAVAIILLSSAEFFLFFRQCRYYGLATFLSTAVAYFYITRDGSSRRTLALAGALAALLAAQYLDYAAVVGCLVVDYAIWGRKKPIGFRGWMLILLPQLIVGSVVCSIWNPLAHQAGQAAYHSPSLISDRLNLLWWNWRDMIACDFLILPLALACPLLYIKSKSTWLFRAPMALVVFITMIAMTVPTSLAEAHNAEVRYLAPAVPLCIGVAIVAVAGAQSLSPKVKWTLLALSVVSTFIEPGPDDSPVVFGSTAIMYYHELAIPQVESYSAVIGWINQHVPAGASVYVQPGYKAYPLMFRASKAVYAWQLNDTEDIFTANNPAPGEMPTLTATDESGAVIASVSVTNPPDPTPDLHVNTPASVAEALVKAWNQDPRSAGIAMARGGSTFILATLNGKPLHISSSVGHATTGTLTMNTVLPRSDFVGLPDIHFRGRVAPDFIIQFGSNSESDGAPIARRAFALRGVDYDQIETIHLNWKDLFRPERIWRSFVTIPPKEGDEIYIYRREDQNTFKGRR